MPFTLGPMLIASTISAFFDSPIDDQNHWSST